jgi:hypothetical protein
MMTELLLWCLVVAAYLAQARELRRMHRGLDEMIRQNDLTVKLLQRQIDVGRMR